MGKQRAATESLDVADLEAAQAEARALLPEDVTTSPHVGEDVEAGDVGTTSPVDGPELRPFPNIASDVKDVVRVVYAAVQVVRVKRSDTFEPSLTRSTEIGADLGSKLARIIAPQPKLDGWIRWLGLGCTIAAPILEGEIRTSLAERKARLAREAEARKAGLATAQQPQQGGAL